MTTTGSFAYLSCKDVTRRLMTQKSELQTNANMINQLEYPHNLLRNIAKQTSLTEYVLGKWLKLEMAILIHARVNDRSIFAI